MKANFEKIFDNSYSYFREIQILTYLNQRGAPVPVLKEGFAKDKIITMEYVGVNLHDQKNVLSLQNKLAVSLNLIQAVCSIYELGILHYDIALRNLTSKENDTGAGSSLYVIDFSVSTSSLFKLQKPLWILPRLDKQHKVFVDAISKDWRNFFNFYDKKYPKNLNENIKVSRQDYENYWVESLNVERINWPLSVIFHNVSFALEELFASNATELKSYNLKESINALKNTYDDNITKRKIEQVKEHIEEISNNIGGFVPTPIPLISKGNNFDKNLIKEKNYIAQKKYERYFHMILLATMFYFVDRGYSYNQISISDFDYYIGLFSALTWIIYLTLLPTRKGFALKIFNLLLSLQLVYFLFRVFFETEKFVFPLIGSTIVFIIAIRSFLIKS